MCKIKLITCFCLSLGIPFFSAFSQTVTYDFENDTAGGTEFIIGQSPTSIHVINFTLETVDNPALAHSGTKALVLVPGATEGKILMERGVQDLQFYVADTQGGGRLELRDKNFQVTHENGIVEGFPADISPGANPPAQNFVAFNSDIFVTTDLNFTNGIKEIKIVNPSGQISIDDLTFTNTAGPPNNIFFEDFPDLGNHPIFKIPVNRANFTLGTSPVTATFTGGIVTTIFHGGNAGAGRPFNHTYPLSPSDLAENESASWRVLDEMEGEINFTESPMSKVEFYAAVGEEGDGTIEVYDTADNLLTSTSDIPLNMSFEIAGFPFTFFSFVAEELGAPGGIGKIIYKNAPSPQSQTGGFLTDIAIDDIGFTPLGVEGPPPAEGPAITTQPTSQEVASGTAIALTVAASGEDITYQWFTGNSGDTASPVAGATSSTLTTGALTVSTNFWAQVTNAGGTADSDTAVITVAAPAVPLVLDGSGDIAGENIQHANGNVFDQILLTGESVQLQAKPGQITRVSFMDENEDIVQVEFSGNGTFTVTLDPATFLPPAVPPRYNQAVEYVTGRPSVVIDGADANTFFSIFTVGRINAFNQALFPEGQVYDAQADVSLVEVVNSTGLGGVQLSNTVFSGSTGRVGVDARGVPIAVRLTVGDIDADGDAVPHLLFGEGSFTVPAGNPGLRITGGDLLQTNGAAVVVAESGSTTTGFDTLITQNNFKSDNTPQPTLSIDATFTNEDGDAIEVVIDEITIE